jgi:hypothetical protein
MEEKEQKRFYNPIYSILFNKIKDIKTPIKNDLLKSLLDGQWHSELELIRVTKKQYGFVGAVTLGTMVNSLNHSIKNNYLQRKIIKEKLHYKISDNFVGLTRAAYRFDAKRFF